jgi:opacity protein-like surface antigen
MKLKLITSALIACVSTAALADEITTTSGNTYVRIDGGYSSSMKFKHNNFIEDTTKKHKMGSAGVFGGGVGYRFNENVRTDLTISYRPGYSLKFNDTVDPIHYKGKVKSLVGLANVYYDVATYGVVTPYVTAGMGIARNTLKNITANTQGGFTSFNGASKNNFAWTIGAGASTSLGNGFAFDLGYRFINLGKIKSGRNATIHNITFNNYLDAGYKTHHIRAHEIMAGIRYEF